MAKIHRLITGIIFCGALFIYTIFGFAQNLELAANRTTNQPANSEAAVKPDDLKTKTEQMLTSDMETNKGIEDPTTLLWLLQTTMNNTKMGMPLKKGNYYQSSLQFEPMLPNELSKKWTIGFRPVLDFYDSQPYPDPKSINLSTNPPTPNMKRMTSFGDMTLGIGVNPDPKLVHNFLICAGTTFIFPTATHDVLGQKNWQAGPITTVGYKGLHYLTYILQQTWWKIGGDGQRTRQTWARYTYFYNWQNGWSLGTQSDMFVDWQAARAQRLNFPAGLQVGKLVHAGVLPVKVDMQVMYYAVRPTTAGKYVATEAMSPKWNFQLQFTPIIPTFQEILRHQIPVDPTRKKRS